MGKKYSAEEIKALTPHVLRLSTLLTRERAELPVSYLSDPALREAYAAYFLPRNLHKIHHPLAELGKHPSGLPRRDRLRVLDMGTGPGTAVLGMIDFFSRFEPSLILDFTAVDPVRENLALAKVLFQEAMRDLPYPGEATLTTVIASAERLALPSDQRFDIMVFCNSMNEIARDEDDRVEARAEILLRLTDRHLEDDGSCIIIEPSLRETSRELLELRDLLIARGLGIYSPCLCAAPCPALEHPKDWCHEDLPWEPPAHVLELGRLAGLRPDSLKFSYLVVRKDSLSLNDAAGSDSWRVVSEPLRSKGKLEFHVCGAGGRKLATRLDREKSRINEEFERLSRGATVIFSHAEERGAGLRVHRETEVRVLG